ncbi:MAG: sigma-54 dependent transcriptional regulator, acetoin dehydrogenase operon transcriptional [Clostridiales bacterium]|nr:sigma-54 dependent transcriptional regulator, acetoin dehydrogenase operon transcriptional [Clostridiales bacterium]
MRKRLGIVTSSKNVGIEYIRQIQLALGDGFDIVAYSFESNNTDTISHVDALLISTISQYEILKNYIPKEVDVIISKLTISKAGYALLKADDLPKSAMMVNLSFEMCIETIATLLQLGLEGVELVPVYPNMDTIPDLNVAITTGEEGLVPSNAKRIINLGHRLIDKNTILEIAVAMSIEDALMQPGVTAYFDNLVSYNYGVEFLISKSDHLSRQFKTLLSIMEKGVISINSEGMIENCNQAAQQMVGESNPLIGLKAISLFSELDMTRCLSTKTPILNQLTAINDHLLTVSIVPVRDLENTETNRVKNGIYMLLENFESEEDKQNMLRLQLAKKGHIAKYSVDSIVGESKVMEDVCQLVRRMGNSKSAVLITGESGTGKELTAQAIHNASPFRNKQFVAINCAAISANLLESELFGYEAGAFTGALKGGKMGILELAHNGTLFLDEIGEMPLELQAKLLRVIQEKEVMRVGGNKIIKVNFRMIAATNKNLMNEVDAGRFRQDLFYRINVLPIHIPALRERADDIPVLIESIKKQEGYAFQISEKLMLFLKAYHWKGNVRELRNCIEYFDNIGKAMITVEDLPRYMLEMQPAFDPMSLDRRQEVLDARETFVLKLLYESFIRRRRLGRRSISERAFESQLYLSEYDVRAIMNSLKEKGLIFIGAGRGGSTISQRGIEWIKHQ